MSGSRMPFRVKAGYKIGKIRPVGKKKPPTTDCSLWRWSEVDVSCRVDPSVARNDPEVMTFQQLGAGPR